MGTVVVERCADVLHMIRVMGAWMELCVCVCVSIPVLVAWVGEAVSSDCGGGVSCPRVQVCSCRLLFCGGPVNVARGCCCCCSPLPAVATAQCFFHRAWEQYREEVQHKFGAKEMGLACIFLASKCEECARKVGLEGGRHCSLCFLEGCTPLTHPAW